MSVYKQVGGNVRGADKSYHIRCVDQCPEHWIEISWWPDDVEFVYVCFHLTSLSGFWERLKLAWRVLRGHRSKFGDFGEVLLDKEEVMALRDVCAEILEDGSFPSNGK